MVLQCLHCGLSHGRADSCWKSGVLPVACFSIFGQPVSYKPVVFVRSGPDTDAVAFHELDNRNAGRFGGPDEGY